jgi:hypothetical protein
MNEVFYKNVRPVPRTMDEAYKTPSYAQAIWKCETEQQRGLSALVEKIVGYAFMFAFGFLVSAMTVWLTRI